MSETVNELGAAKKVTEYEYDSNGNLTFKELSLLQTVLIAGDIILKAGEY